MTVQSANYKHVITKNSLKTTRLAKTVEYKIGLKLKIQLIL